MLVGGTFGTHAESNTPEQIPPKRSPQITDGFGINTPLPREPYLPWNKHWWTCLFDAGFGWVRIGQYENSSEQTSWDWVEQKRGIYAVTREVDDYVDSLVDNNVKIQLQLLYGNPMYTGRVGKFPDSILPASPGVHPPDLSLHSIFWGPSTSEQRAAFLAYAKWMVRHFRGRISYYALWNEEDEYFWNESGNAQEYAALLREFIMVVHQADPRAKVVFGGLGNTKREFTQRVLQLCRCAPGIDVFAYHSYPGYGTNTNPEQMDAEKEASQSRPQMLCAGNPLGQTDTPSSPPAESSRDSSIHHRAKRGPNHPQISPTRHKFQAARRSYR
jgi:hypothetical protein